MAEKTKKPANPAVVQTVKCIAVLVVICLVCVALLALLNDLLYVAPPSADDAITAIHPDFVRDTDFNESLDTEIRKAHRKNTAYGEILSIARCKTCGAIVLESLGTGGFQGGTVTLYVVVDSDAKIAAWSIIDNVNQSYISRIPANAGSSWYVGESVTKELDKDMTGATVKLTADAIWNAVNMAAYFSRMALGTELGLGEIVDPSVEAQEAATELLANTEFSDVTLSKLTYSSLKVNNDSYASVLSDGDDELSFIFKGQGTSGTVFVYVFGTEESNRKLVAVSNGQKVALSDNVSETDEIYKNILKYSLYSVGNATIIVSLEVTGEGETVYTVEAFKLSNYDPSNYKLTVTITNDGGVGKVTAIEFAPDGDGWADGYEEEAPHDRASIMKTLLVGATLDTIDGLYNDYRSQWSDTTQSANLITAAVKAALAHFDASLAN